MAGVKNSDGEYSRFVLACFNEKVNKHESVCVLAIGLTDSERLNLTKLLKTKTIERPDNYVCHLEIDEPMDWFNNETCIDIFFDDICFMDDELKILIPRYDCPSVRSVNTKSDLKNMWCDMHSSDEE